MQEYNNVLKTAATFLLNKHDNQDKCCVVNDHATSTQCLLYEIDNIYYLSFNCFKSVNHAWINTSFSKSSLWEWDTSIKIHSVFLSVYERIRLTLRDILIKTDIKQLVITGHGVGSVLGNLFMYDIATKFKPNFNVSLLCFGAPKFCNRQFKKHTQQLIKEYNYTWDNIILKYDLTPLLPWKSTDYTIPGNIVRMPNKQFYIIEYIKYSISKLSKHNFKQCDMESYYYCI
jgi:hypothetical protein